MGVEGRPLLSLLQISDTAFPTGAFAHSQGLEAFHAAGELRDARDLGRLLELQLSALSSSDCVALRAAHEDDSQDLGFAVEADRALTATRLARELRESSAATGRRFLGSVRALGVGGRVERLAALLHEGKTDCNLAVCYAVACAELELSKSEALRAYLYTSASSLVAAAQKLVPLGGGEAQRALYEASAVIEQAEWKSASTLTSTLANTPMITATAASGHDPRFADSRRTGGRGELRLRVARRGERSALVERYTSAPFGSLRASYPGDPGTPELQITNPAGGVLGGDRLGIEVSLEAGSAATVLTQGATKAYRGPASSQIEEFEVGEGAFLEYLPHHLIPYAGSGHRLRTEFRLAESSTLIAWEALSAGRVARGERFAFDYLSSRARLQVGGKPWISDGLELAGGAEAFGGYSYMGTALIQAPSRMGTLADDLHESLQQAQTGKLASASAPAPGLCTARVLCADAESLYRALNLIREMARAHLSLPPAAREIR